MKKYKDRLVNGLLKFLTQGLTAQKLSLTISLGITLGILPIIGPTTGLCIGASFLFRLNLAALQFVNYACYPFQILCLIPYYQLGAFVFNDAAFTLNLATLKDKFSTDLAAALTELWTATWHAAVAWLITAPFLILMVYYTSFPVIRKILLKKKQVKMV